MNCKLVLISALSLCLVAHCTLAQYQTAPAYGNSYQQQQRKIAPSSQSYGQSASSAGLMEGPQMGGSSDYEAQQQQSSQMGDQKYGGVMQSSGSAYGSKQQQMGAGNGGYSKLQSAGSNSGNSYGGAMGQSTMAGYGSKSGMAGAKYEEPQHPPMPFAYGYDINDGYGNTQYRKENGDEQGKVTGSYGYRDAYGVFRYVDYIADENGFRATVKTNEPGTANESPADVDWQAQEPPAQTNPGNKQAGGYGSGSGGASGSYGMGGASGNNEASSSYGQSSSNGMSSYGSGSSSASSALMDGQDMSQYASSASTATSSQQGANKYGGSQQGSQQVPMELARQSGGSYGASMMSMASSSADNGADSYGSSANSMANGSGAGQYSSGRSAMVSQANGRRAYGSGMMAALGAGRQGAGAYGQQGATSGIQMQPMNDAVQYGSSNNGGQYMGAANGQQTLASAGRSSRYKTSGMSSAAMGSRASGYGSALDQMEQQQQQYGALPSMAREAMQQEMLMGATKGAGNGRSSYGNNNQMGLSMSSIMDDVSGQQQYGADSALAQQYGGAQTSGASRMMLAAMQANDASQQQYSASGMGMTDSSGPTSTYSSMRIQPTGGSPRSQNSGYGNSNGGPNGTGSMAYQSKMSGASKTNQASGMTDYRKVAGKNIAALAKRY